MRDAFHRLSYAKRSLLLLKVWVALILLLNTRTFYFSKKLTSLEQS